MSDRPAARSPRSREKSLLEENHHIPRPYRVFTNRNLRLESVSAIGFDLDHTLAHYDPIPVEKLAFEMTKQKLVEKREYPEEILKLKYNPEFVIRGLIVDKRRGNVLKMDQFRYVRRVYHGRRPLSKEERGKIYRTQHLRLAHPNYVSVDTLFHLPEVYLFATLVDFFEARRKRKDMDYLELYQDVRNMIDEAHGDGSLKRVIVEKPGQFVRRDPKLAVVLEEFRRSGKKLFLLTNSEYYYSDALLRHLLERKKGDRPWESYFDVLLFDAGKPGFFLSEKLDKSDVRPVETRFPRSAFSGGNARFLEDRVGAHGDEILYFGDHTYGDILRSKKTLGWRTAMIVPEIEREVKVTEQLSGEYDRLAELIALHDQIELAKAEAGRRLRRMQRDVAIAERDAVLCEGSKNPRKKGRKTPSRSEARLLESIERLDHRASSLAGEIRALRRRIESTYNPYWGSVFREGAVVTRFGDQVRSFACLYTSRVSNFLRYPWNYFFQSPRTLMPHDL